MCCGRKKSQRRRTTGRKSGRFKQEAKKVTDEQYTTNQQRLFIPVDDGRQTEERTI